MKRSVVVKVRSTWQLGESTEVGWRDGLYCFAVVLGSQRLAAIVGKVTVLRVCDQRQTQFQPPRALVNTVPSVVFGDHPYLFRRYSSSMSCFLLFRLRMVLDGRRIYCCWVVHCQPFAEGASQQSEHPPGS